MEEILREAEEIADGSRSASPSRAGRSLSDSALSRLLRESGVQEVPLGFRSSFRDRCADAERAGEIAEAVLAHTLRGVEGACFVRDGFGRRRGLIEVRADCIAGSASASPSRAVRSLSDSALSRLLRESGVQEVPLGFRSSFRDRCADAERAGEIAEAVLAHTLRGVEGACFVRDVFGRRRGLIEVRADCIAGSART